MVSKYQPWLLIKHLGWDDIQSFQAFGQAFGEYPSSLRDGSLSLDLSLASWLLQWFLQSLWGVGWDFLTSDPGLI